TITNGTASPLSNVGFSDMIDSNTTYVANSLTTSPIAFDDAYAASGNIPITISAPGVLSNDTDPDTGNNSGLTVTQVQGAAANVGVSTNTTATGIGGLHGSVTLNANGSFTYEPPPGFAGNDTFIYQISDGAKTDTATVTLNISGMAWFIDNSASASLNRGTFSQPFKTIAAFNAANTGAAPNPQAGDAIALRSGSGTYSETDGINLRDNQKLVGEAVAFNTVFTASANSSSAYTTFAGGTNTAPTVVTSAGNGVDLGSGNTVKGLNVGNTPGFFGFNGTAVGSLTIATVSKTGTGGAINITTSGAFGSTVNFATLESTSSASANLNLVGVTGTLGVTAGGTGLSGSAASSAAININGGSISLSYAGNVSKSNTGSLLSVTGGHATGTLSFSGTLSASAGNGLQFDNADGTYNFNGTTTLNGGDAGIDILNGSDGTFSFSNNTTLTSPTGTAFNVNASSPGVTYGGTITQNNAARIVDIQGTASQTVTINGTVTGGASSTGVHIGDTTTANGNVTFTTLNLGTSGSRMTSQAVTITGGTGSYSLGTVSIFTNNASGIVATNVDGTLNCSSASTVDSSNATAISIDGPVGLTSLGMSLTSVTSAGGSADGISIQDTNGSFTINGDGANTAVGGNATGGTISNKSGTDGSTTAGIGIYLNNVQNITLRRITISGTNQ
ncbi:MAG TPA: Ig-like domain-containing protein, partial [Blastocatellia bacterium]|nr:Ig-like domain-containing protein [Blastocatellia bacterium]